MAPFTSDITLPTQQISDKQLDADPLGLGGLGSKPYAANDLFTASSTVLSPAGASNGTTRKAKKPIPQPTATKDITKDILFDNNDLLAENLLLKKLPELWIKRE